MGVIYIEFLTELKIMLKEVEKSWWYQWMNKSIEKYNSTQDVSYFLEAFGGCGSFNDEPINNEATIVLKSIVYDMAKIIENQSVFDFASVLQKEQNHLINAREYLKKDLDFWGKEQQLDSNENQLNYINYIIKNYSVGNLHEITTEYLMQKDINNKKR